MTALESHRIAELEMEISNLRMLLMQCDQSVAQQRQIEEALERAERRFHLLADSAIDAIIVVRDGLVLDANRAAALIFAVADESEFLGGVFTDLFDEESRPAVLLQLEYVTTGEHEHLEGLGRRADGTTFPVEIKTRILSRPGEEKVMVVAIRDITAQKKAEWEKLEVERQLQHAQKMEAIGRLAGGIAHDMNNLLGAILSSASALELEGSLSGSAAGDIESIVTACRRGRDLTRDLLGFARKGKYVKRDVSIGRVVQTSAGLLFRTITRKVDLRIHLSPGLDHVEADAGQLEHALMNILINATDAMETGGVLTVSARNLDIMADSNDAPASGRRMLPPGRYVELVVRDTGIGMDTKTLDRVFEPFFTTKPRGKGTGLGLSMVYGTIQNHHGDVFIESAPGEGTAVHILLPSMMRTVPSTTPASTPLIEEPADTDIEVLLVDDEPMILRSTRRVLEKLGYTVQTAAGAREAVAIYRERYRSIRVVILDMLMPQLDGAETFELLQSIHTDVRVIICSGYAKDEKVEGLIAMGAKGFVQKPFDIDSLTSAIAAAL